MILTHFCRVREVQPDPTTSGGSSQKRYTDLSFTGTDARSLCHKSFLARSGANVTTITTNLPLEPGMAHVFEDQFAVGCCCKSISTNFILICLEI